MASVTPTLERLQEYAQGVADLSLQVVPVVREVEIGDNTPVSAFLKVRRGKYSFLMESSTDSNMAKDLSSIIGTEPYDLTECGVVDTAAIPRSESFVTGDPLIFVQETLAQHHVPTEFRLQPPVLNGGLVGYVGYDCMKYIEPKVGEVAQHQTDALKIPEAMFLHMNSFVAFDHNSNKIRIVALVSLKGDIAANFAAAVARIDELEGRLGTALPEPPVAPADATVTPSADKSVSNVGQAGYEGFVTELKKKIVDGWIIQAVPSQRIARPLGVHPFDLYQELRVINPSRYMAYFELDEFEIVCGSPEVLAKVTDGVVVSHPIAGTRHRGKTDEEDIALAKELLGDPKDRAEHIMLVDLGRNDVNRVCIPESVTVDSLMHIEKFSHVMHIVSCLSGKLRPECTPLDAFRSIMPAGTVSGAPKVSAMTLLAGFEKEKRGIYAGALGYFAFDGNIDTCIAIRTVVVKNQTAYLQAGGGIVFDSVEYDEYIETMNKMGALARAIDACELKYKPTIYSPSLILPAHKELSASTGKWNELWGGASDIAARPTKKARTDSAPVPEYSTGPALPGVKRVLMIDNYDSFTWNVFQYLRKCGVNVEVHRNDKVTVQQCLDLDPDLVVLSPGPGWPADSGVCMGVLRAFEGKKPILGVCLGHECIVERYAGKITHCNEVMHGKTSQIEHDGRGVYAGLPQSTTIIRYHSLAATYPDLPFELEVTSRTVGEGATKGVIMGVRHKTFKVEGVQFHPESIKSDDGLQMLKNFVTWEGGLW